MKIISSANRAVILIFALCLFSNSINAQDYDLITDLNNYWPIQEMPKPEYLQPTTDPAFGTKITRITGDVGAAIQNVNGEVWRNVARHGYSTRQPWNADESIIYLDRHKTQGGSWGPALFLDGETYEVIKEANVPSNNEIRWHPTNPDIMLIIRDDGIYSWSYSSGTTTQLMAYSGYSGASTGYTGNFTHDGTKISVFATRNSDSKQVVFALDFANNIKYPDIDFSGIDIDWLSISPLGNYTMVNGNYGNGGDRTKIFDLAGNQVGPYWSEYGRPSHFDLAVDLEGNEVAVGVSKSNPDDGRVIKRRLIDGQVTVLTQGGYASHGSARSLNRPGWVFTISTDNQNWGPYFNEIIGVKLDGTRVERIAHGRNLLSNYENQAQVCPSPSGNRVLYASDWRNNNFPVHTFVVDFRDLQISTGVNAGSDQEICIGDAATLTATGTVSYSWNTGETTASITVNPSITTTYTVTGTSSDGSTSTDTITVTVNSIPIANAGADQTICEGEETTLNASGGNTYLWSNGATTQNITVSPTSTTNYSVIVSQGSCSSTDEVMVTVKPRQTINAGNDVDIYLGESATLTVVGTGNILWSTGETTALIIVSPTNTTTYTVSVIETNGCASTDDVIVTVVNNFSPNAGVDVTICEGESTILTASGGTEYLWNTGETTANITVNPMSTTIYSVLVTKDSNSGTDEVTVFVDSPPELQVSDDKTINLGEYVTLSVSGADTYEWSNGATQPNIAVSPQQTTVYSVIGYTNDCSDIAQVTVNVANSVIAYAGKDMTICSGDTQTLIANGGETYLWSTGEITKSIDVAPSEDTTYTVIVSNDYASDTASVSVFVIDCGEEDTTNYQYSVYPNPTSDGILRLQLSGLIGTSNLYIQDTVGKLVYMESISDNNGELIQKQLDISRFSSGLYFVTLQEANRTTTKKIIFR
ncbi:MAG: T9SS type A sorting domain-containing protein [Chlorobi bacterium]|nr:T9SS type A sorting domain-containing protein [Chlorobiota bacterium]